jgi:major vault protein
MKPAEPSGEKPEEEEEKEEENTPEGVVKPDEEIPDLTTGKLLIIKGTDVSFYIPPTGIEVVPDKNGKYVRDAVTLERLEYCILLDENGDKRYVRGPDVVFPKPTETFVEQVEDDSRKRKFRAIELNTEMGLYIKVIADYREDKKEYKAGEELFITGEKQKIYFPRPEHAILRYGEREEIHYAVAIPAGEARYVLNKQTGEVELVKGPMMFLADPRTQVIVRRVLSPETVKLWYPGNEEALRHNIALAALTRGKPADHILTDKEVRKSLRESEEYESSRIAARPEGAIEEGFAGEEFRRRTTFTPPRTIVLDTKYEGAPAVSIWTGFAVQVVSKTGERRVVVGPETVLMGYGETLEVLELSTGTPKSDDQLIRTVYLRVVNNTVSDIVEAETKDAVEVRVRVSYRVNFEGNPNKWFNAENYVKLLTDHLRSMIRNAVKQHGIEDFNDNAISIIRDTVLGTPGEDGKRTGRAFEENGMRVYDVEVLDVGIGDEDIAELLIGAQHQAVQQTLQFAEQERELELTQRSESIKQQIDEAQAQTNMKNLELQMADAEKQHEAEMAKIAAEAEAEQQRLEDQLSQQERLDKINKAKLAREKARENQRLALAKVDLDQSIEDLNAKADALVKKFNAIQPDLIAAIQSLSDKQLAIALAENLPQATGAIGLLLGKGGMEGLLKMFKGTPIEKALRGLGQETQKLSSKEEKEEEEGS